MTRTAWVAVLGAGALAASPALADPLPLRIDYQAAASCPSGEVFLDEVRWRTALARVAAAGEEALEVRVRITRRGEAHLGRVSLGGGRTRVVRDIEGAVCDEVVSALALVTALAVDPRASIARRPPPAPPPPAVPPAPSAPPGPSVPSVPEDARAVPEALPPPELAGPPLPALPSPPEAATDGGGRPSWAVAAWASSAFAVTPRPILGGGISGERSFGGRWAPSLRLTVEVGGTGAFDVGPGGASFVRGAARVEGCAFAWRPVEWLSLVPCLAAEGGALHGEGLSSGTVTRVEQVTVPWAALGALPRLGLGSGRWFLALSGGPVLPLVRRSFVFQSPAYVVYTLPPVTATVGLGGGVRFP